MLSQTGGVLPPFPQKERCDFHHTYPSPEQEAIGIKFTRDSGSSGSRDLHTPLDVEWSPDWPRTERATAAAAGAGARLVADGPSPAQPGVD